MTKKLKQIITGVTVGAGAISAPIIAATSVKQETKTEYVEKEVIKEVEKEVIKEIVKKVTWAGKGTNETSLEKVKRIQTELGYLGLAGFNMYFILKHINEALTTTNNDIPLTLAELKKKTYKGKRQYTDKQLKTIENWLKGSK